MQSTKCEKCSNCECNKRFFSLPLNKTKSNTTRSRVTFDTSVNDGGLKGGYGDGYDYDYGYATHLSHYHPHVNNNIKSCFPYSDSVSNIYADSHSHVHAPVQNTRKKVALGLSNRNVYASTNTTATTGKMKLKNPYDKTSGRPFNPFCGETPRLFTAPPLVPKTKGRAITTSLRNYDAGTRRDFTAVPQGVELYEENPMNDDIRISRAEFEKLVSKAWTLSTTDAIGGGPKYQNGRKCTELDQPKFNTTKKSVRQIQEAVGHLRNIPLEIENYVKHDPLFKQKINENVTKKLNVALEAKIYKDIFPVQPLEAERIKSAEEIRKEIQALHPPPKPKDPEPNILMFNKPTYSRIKPKLPDPPSKPQKGVSTDVSEDFYLMKSELQFSEKGSNASVFEKRVQDDAADE